jgi:PII-like signaling protein
MAGFGRHHRLHENHFFELAGSLTIEIEFVVSDDEARQLFALIEAERIRVPYARMPVEFGVLNPDGQDASA